jgi:predicted RNA binding protein YcfA (HicA-like mRNA interferase family)
MLFAVHEAERVGPKLMAKILKDAGITAEAFRRLI